MKDSSTSDQIDLINTTVEFCKTCPAQFQTYIHHLYMTEVLEEDAVWDWVEQQKQGGDTRFLDLCQPFLDWLRDALPE